MENRVKVEGIDYTAPAVEDARKSLIELRNGALDQGEMHWAMLLSHVIAYLHDYAILLEQEKVRERFFDKEKNGQV